MGDERTEPEPTCPPAFVVTFFSDSSEDVLLRDRGSEIGHPRIGDEPAGYFFELATAC
jgi:hypothetical protein